MVNDKSENIAENKKNIVAPTLVIGIGQAGTNVVQTLRDTMDDIDRQYIRFIAIDSFKDDLDKTITSKDISKIVIGQPTGDMEAWASSCKYLYPRIIIGHAAKRQRVFGRFLLDIAENYSTAYNLIGEKIDELSQIQREIDLYAPKHVSLNVCLIHSLGGGTGSGTFPLLLSMIKDNVKNIGILDNEYFIYGIGFLPSATNLNIEYKNISKTYFSNSYGALLELQCLDKANDKPLTSLTLRGSGKEEITENPFNRYFLVGVNEEKLDNALKSNQTERYMEQLNTVVSQSIYALYKYPYGPDNLWQNDLTHFCTFGQTELRVPFDKIKTYIDKNEELKQLKDSLGKDAPEIPMDVKRNIAERNDVSEKSIREFIDTIRKQFGLIGTQKAIELAAKELKNKQAHKINDLNTLIEKLWNTYGLAQKHPDITSSAEMQGTIKNELSRNISEAEAWLAKPPFVTYPGQKNKKERLLSEYQNDNKIIDESNLEIIKLGKLVEYTINLFKIDEINNTMKNIDDVTVKITYLEKDLQEMKTGRMGVVRININKLKEIPPSKLKTIDTFRKAVDTGLVVDLNKAIEGQIKSAIDFSILVKPKRTNAPPLKKNIFVICHEDDQELIKESINPTIEGIAFSTDNTYTSPEYKGKVSFVIYTRNIGIEDVGEFYYRDEEYKKGQLATKAGLNNVGKIFAFPEWFENDPNVQKLFVRLKS